MTKNPVWINQDSPCVGCALATDHDVGSLDEPVRYWFCAWKPANQSPFWVSTEPKLVGPYREGGCDARVPLCDRALAAT